MDTLHVFFSYRTDDKDRVRDVNAALRQLLPSFPFDDVSLRVPFTDDWQTHALTVLESCHAFVCVVGQDTHASGPVDWEIRQAHRLGKPLTITRLSHEYALPPSCAELRIPVLEWDTAELAARIKGVLLSQALFPRHDWTTGPPKPEAIWDQYNLMVQSWEALISRRQTVNTLYVTADAALLAGIGAVASSTDKTGVMGAALGIAVLAFLGFALSFNWRRTLISYGTLSNAKATVITSLEAYMPAQLFDAEWKVLERMRYRSTTETDSQTAYFFMLLFLAIALVGGGVAIAQPMLGTDEINV